MMDMDERLENEQDMNLTLGPQFHEVKKHALFLILNQWKQTGDDNQLIEDLKSLRIKVKEITGRTEVIG